MDRDSPPICTVFGASGFVGTQVTQLLARGGFRVRAAVRRPDLAGHLKPLGDVGQIVPVQANMRNADSVARAVRGASVVINLVARRLSARQPAVCDGERRWCGRCRRGARRPRASRRSSTCRSSAPTAESESAFARSRAEGEAAVREAFPSAIIMRPSLIFGPDDSFFNLMASLSRFFPVMPLIGGKSKFQPVYVGDVAAGLRAGGGRAR